MSKGNRKRRRELGLLPEPSKGGARTRDGSPCKNAPLAGSVRCRMHGGSAPQVLAKAKERLLLAADDAVSVLIRIMFDPKAPVGDRRQAAVALMDRAGLNAKAEVELTVPWLDALQGAVVTVNDEDALEARGHDYSAREAAVHRLPQAGPGGTLELGPDGRVLVVRESSVGPSPHTDLPWLDGNDRPHPRVSGTVRG